MQFMFLPTSKLLFSFQKRRWDNYILTSFRTSVSLDSCTPRCLTFRTILKSQSEIGFSTVERSMYWPKLTEWLTDWLTDWLLKALTKAVQIFRDDEPGGTLHLLGTYAILHVWTGPKPPSFSKRIRIFTVALAFLCWWWLLASPSGYSLE